MPKITRFSFDIFLKSLFLEKYSTTSKRSFCAILKFSFVVPPVEGWQSKSRKGILSVVPEPLHCQGISTCWTVRILKIAVVVSVHAQLHPWFSRCTFHRSTDCGLSGNSWVGGAKKFGFSWAFCCLVPAASCALWAHQMCWSWRPPVIYRCRSYKGPAKFMCRE